MIPEYEGYENLADFTPEGLAAYRQSLLEKSKAQVEFIKKHTCGKLNIVEIGSGNGRLLISLAKAGKVNLGWGLDISESRTAFAKQWQTDLKIKELLFIQRDIVYNDSQFNVDLSICITGCFQYFSYDKNWFSPARCVLDFMRDSSGTALFELYKRPANPRSWHKLPDTDRFMYLLDDYTPDNPTTHTKTFIKRDGTVDIRTEQLYYYTMVQFLDLLKSAGFNNVHWAKENSQSMVVLVS
jgi:hypothetical protein